MGRLQAVYWLYFIYDNTTALLHVPMSRGDGFSSLYQPESLDEVERVVTTEREMDEAAWDDFRAVEHRMHSLHLQLFSHLDALLGSNSLYAFNSDKLLEWDAVKQLRSTTPARPLVLAPLLHETISPLH